jgi:caa(3)-type oxidase subunit IV
MAQHATAHAHGEAHHTNYVKIWAILLVLLVLSVIGPELGIRVVTLITAFGIAIVKAWMVARYFMHLNIERKWVAYILVIMLAFMLVMVGGMAPDVNRHDGRNWQKLYEEPAPGAAGAAH